MTKQKDAPPGPLVLVEWQDSCTPEYNWHNKDEGKKYYPETVFSVGWLARRDKDATVLVASYTKSQIGQMFAIPSGNVKKITRLHGRRNKR